jgi:peroxiredoxin
MEGSGMKTIRMLSAFVAVCALLCAGSATAWAQSGYLSETKALLSKLQSMGHGYRTRAEWDELFAQLDNLETRAQQDRDWDTVVEVNVIKAMVYSDMLGDHQKAVAILQDTKRRYRDQILPAVRKVYIREAEVYSKIGDEAAISRLIKEYKASPLYDPQPYAYWGGQGRDVPLTVVRPNERGDSSLSVTAMETYRMQARFAPGNAFPDFHGADQNGKPVSLSDVKGKVVLFDFWMPNWDPWKREAPNLAGLYRSYSSRGFEIIGFNVAPAAAVSKDFVRAYSMTWPQVTVDPALFRKLGIFGEATSFLIDRDGIIVGRALKGSELVNAVKRTLGVQ